MGSQSPPRTLFSKLMQTPTPLAGASKTLTSTPSPPPGTHEMQTQGQTQEIQTQQIRTQDICSTPPRKKNKIFRPNSAEKIMWPLDFDFDFRPFQESTTLTASNSNTTQHSTAKRKRRDNSEIAGAKKRKRKKRKRKLQQPIQLPDFPVLNSINTTKEDENTTGTTAENFESFSRDLLNYQIENVENTYGPRGSHFGFITEYLEEKKSHYLERASKLAQKIPEPRAPKIVPNSTNLERKEKVQMVKKKIERLRMEKMSTSDTLSQYKCLELKSTSEQKSDSVEDTYQTLKASLPKEWSDTLDGRRVLATQQRKVGDDLFDDYEIADRCLRSLETKVGSMRQTHRELEEKAKKFFNEPFDCAGIDVSQTEALCDRIKAHKKMDPSENKVVK